MELAKRLILDITSSSQGVICDATGYASRRGFKNVQSSHFRLEKEMQRVSVAAEGILGLLSKSSLRNGPPLDDRLEEWFTTDELPTCLDTLHQMRKILKNDTSANAAFTSVNSKKPHSSPAEDKIDATVKLFDSRRNYFHFLLTTDVWNCEEAQHHPRAISIDACDRLAAGSVSERNIKNAKGTRRNNGSAPLNMSTTITEGPGRRGEPDSSRKLDDVLKWLGGLSCAMKQEETLSLRQPDTCTWFQSAPEFESWRNSANSFLWLQGKPGCGKTVLASFVVASLEEKRRDGEALAYFYCDFRNDRSTSASEVMRSLLSQLLRYIRNNNIDAGELVDDLTREKDSDTPILNSVKRLVTILSQAAWQFSHRPLVVVDAMDECKDVDKLLDGLLTLAKGGMRLFVTSRPVPVIKDGLCGLPSISMDRNMSAVSVDIALHVTRELDSRRRLRDLELDFKVEIHAILCDRADGMFRWVQCQIDTLNRCTTRAEVREALNNLPVGLDETYRRILVAIDMESPEGKLALRALVWLIGALRPLRSHEILEGLTIDLGRRTMDCDTGPMHRGALLDACGSLVTYNEETDILILSHFSVKEYLTGDLMRVELPRYYISYQSAHEQLARFCICYLTLYLKHVHGSADDAPLSRVMRIIEGRSQWSNASERTPMIPSMTRELLGYLLTDGFNHLAYLGPSNCVVLNDLIALGLDIQRHPDDWEAIYQMSRQHKPQIPWPSQKHDFMLYILVAFSSASLLLAFLRRSRTLLKPKHQTNPLVYAAHFGKAQHAEMLLSRGAQVNERGLVVDASRLALALEIAVKRRQDTVIDVLLSAGSSVPKHLFTLSTYYYKYPVRIVRSLLETDQFMEWAVEPGNELPSPLAILKQRPPLEHETDIIFIIRRLVQLGAVNHTEHDSVQRTALYFAMQGGYKASLVYLLLTGAQLPRDFISVLSSIPSSERVPLLRLVVEAATDFHAKVPSDNSDTILHLVIAFFGHDCLEAVKILVDAGCDPCALNIAGKTPLHLALERGDSAVADFLLSQKTLPSDTLSAVVESRCPMTWKLKTLRALVHERADKRGITQYEDTLFHRASTWRDPFGNTSGDTPLEPRTCCDSSPLAGYLLATGPGNPPPPDTLFSVLQSDLPPAWKTLTIFSLVGKGADVRVVSANGNTLLHAAMLDLDEPCGLKVAQILAGGGCDPFQRNANLRTPFHFALDRDLSLIVDYLLSLGPLPPEDCLFSILHSPLSGDRRARIIRSLVEKGVDVSALSPEGNTLVYDAMLTLPLHHGLDAVQVLVDAGCDPSQCTQKGKTGETPLHIAITRGYIPVVRCLLSRTTSRSLPVDILTCALGGGTDHADYKWRNICPILQLLINKGANVHVRVADRSTLLHLAIKNAPHSESSRRAGSFADEVGSDEYINLLDVVKLLVQSGCDPCLFDANERPPAYFAITTGHIDAVEYLLPRTDPLPPKCLKNAIDSLSSDAQLKLRDSFGRLAETWDLNHESEERRFSFKRIFRLHFSM